MEEIAVEGKDVSGIEFVCHVNEACIGKISLNVPILLHDLLDRPGTGIQFEGNLEDPLFHAGENILHRPGHKTKQVKSLGDHGLAGYRLALKGPVYLQTQRMIGLAFIVGCDQETCIGENRFHLTADRAGFRRARPILFWPKSSINFLFVARLGNPLS